MDKLSPFCILPESNELYKVKIGHTDLGVLYANNLLKGKVDHY